MSTAFIGEVRAFPYTFAPQGWLPCDGTEYEIGDYRQLFYIIGTTYGGNGRQKFAVPNISGRSVIGVGTSKGGTAYRSGQQGGASFVELNMSQMPSHNHSMIGANIADPDKKVQPTAGTNGSSYISNLIKKSTSTLGYAYDVDTDGLLNNQSATITGGNNPHYNMMPYQCIQYFICFDGVFPQRH